MAKFAGMPVTITIDNTGGSGINVSNDVSSFDLNVPVGEQVVTGVDKSAEERLQLLQDFSATLKGRGLASSATRAVLFEALGTTRTLVIDLPDSATCTAEVFLYNLQISRGEDATITWSVECRLNNGTALAWS